MPGDALIPSLIADAGEQVAWRYVDSYTANIRNPNIRRAYARACISHLDRRAAAASGSVASQKRAEKMRHEKASGLLGLS